jgi:uncharacterized protein
MTHVRRVTAFTSQRGFTSDTHTIALVRQHGTAITMIEHDTTNQRFTLQQDGQLAYVQYQLHGSQMDITSTHVPDAIGGQGIAGQLNKHALDHARNAGLSVQPTCSYTQAWLRRHPQYQDLLED